VISRGVRLGAPHRLAPDLGQLYYRFLNPTNLYQVIGNPNLRPERAKSFQLGGEFSSSSRRARLGINVFYNDVDNLIDSVSLGFIATQQQLQAVAQQEGIDLTEFRPALGRLLFYYKNISEARTYDVELDKEKLLVAGFDLKSGRELWRKEFAATFTMKDSGTVSKAAPTPAVDAKRLYVFFESGDLLAFSIIAHRRGGDFAKGDGRHPITFGEDYNSPAGRRVVLNDSMKSSYRTWEHALADLNTIAHQLAQQYPESNKGWSVTGQKFYDWIVPEQSRRALLVFAGAVIFVLLIACSNVANLLLARGAARQRELAIRLALGAGRGRDFDERDGPESQPVTIISEEMARRYWPGEDPLGKTVTLRSLGNKTYKIIGVAGDVRSLGLDTEPGPTAYVSTAVMARAIQSRLVVRTRTEPATQTAAVRGVLRSIDANVPVIDIQTIEQLLYASLGSRRFNMFLLGSFAAVALLLASVGLFGVMAYLVSQRTHEIGIRLALGARPRDVFRLVIGRGMLLAAMGAAVGLVAAFGLARYLETLLFQIRPHDGLAFTAAPALLLGVALLACYLPARRATKVDPLAALRHE
jgi:hypothetical protein